MAGKMVTLEKCIEKYGQELGIIEFEKLQRDRDRRNTRRSIPSTAPKIECMGCHKKFNRITLSHLKYSCVESLTLEEYSKKYPGSLLVSDECRALSGVTESGMIAKYGEIDGKEKWQRYISLQSESNTFEYKEKKFGYTKEDFDEFNKSRSITLEKCIIRHGVDKGIEMWNNYVDLQRYTNTLEYFNKKYGDSGKERWEEYNLQKGKSMSLEWIKEKYGVDHEGAEEIISKRCHTKFTSKIEVSFLDNLELVLGERFKYTVKTRQFSMWSHSLNSPVFFDAVDTVRKKIIEFNGDYWHCNPKKYDGDFFNSSVKKTANEIWLRESKKIQTAIDRGYDVKIVWESDYLNDPEKTIKEVKEWLLR